VGRLILLIILGLGVGMYFPNSRAVLLDKGEPVLRPMLICNAQRDLEKIILGVQQNKQVELLLPARGEWVRSWLRHLSDLLHCASPPEASG
jgi:hypothetical protein